MRRSTAVILVPALLAMGAAAHAEVKISSAATSNVACSNGVCVPTAKDAVLNVGDLESLLASGNVKVTTTGSGVQADDIEIDAPLTWSGANALSLDAYQSIMVEKPVAITAAGGLSITTNDGGKGGFFAFVAKGQVTFANLLSPLTINGTSYTLVNSVRSLANAIAANSSGAFALASNYNAKVDGTYSEAPVQTGFTGTFEGLGNTISDLAINGSGVIGLFQVAYATIENLDMRHIKYTVSGESIAGGLAEEVGTVSHVRVTGTIRGTGSMGNRIGGLAGGGGPLANCSANVQIIENKPSVIGGLIGLNGGTNESFATGSVTATAEGSVVGGLVAANTGTIQNSYATGPVTGGARSQVGGLVGENGENREDQGTIQTSYSTGAVSGGNHSKVGGFAGINRSRRGYVQQSYWDTTTSGTDEGTGKGNKSGITGLTTQQLQSGLPSGFDPKVWAENPKVNDGLPYLIANPPSQ